MTDTTRKKVVFLLPALTAGGAERVLITLMNELDRTRFEPAFITVSEQGTLGPLIADGVPFHALSKSGRVGRSLPRLYKKLRQLKPDIVISTMAHMNFGVLLLKPFFTRTKFIVREAITPSFILQDRGMAEPIIRFLYRFLYPKAATVISPAQAIIDEFSTLLHMKTDNFSVLPNPVDVEAIRNAGELPPRQSPAPHFICAGRLHTQKGFDRLIAALPREMDFNLTILGEGPERENLQRLINERGFQDKIFLTGLFANPWPHYAAADAFLLPSRWEGLPNVALEALACGTPVIATAEAGGIAEIAAAAPQGAVTVVHNMTEFIAAMRNTSSASTEVPRPSLLPVQYRKENVIRQFMGLL